MTDQKPAKAQSAVLLWAAVLFAIGVPALQAIFPFALSARDFAADGNETLRAAGFAFAIWTLLYAGLVGYAFNVSRSTKSRSPAQRTLYWPSIVAISGCGLWILASASDLKAATIAIIAFSAASLLLALIRARPLAAKSDRLQTLWPLGLLAGWLTIATAINALTVLTAWGWIDAASAPAWAGGGVALVFAAGLAGLWLTRLPAYALPIAWGLIGVYARRDHSSPDDYYHRFGLRAGAGVTCGVGLGSEPPASSDPP